MTTVERCRRFLRERGASRLPHGARSLYDHLEGTHALLSRWAAPFDVRMAGLCHSIYGTGWFEPQLVGFEDRAHVRSVIGATAERLVYIFCVTLRPAAFLTAIDRPECAVRNGMRGEHIALAREDLAALLEIECANLMEQRTGRAYLRKLNARAAERSDLLSTAASVELRATLAAWDAQRDACARSGAPLPRHGGALP